MHRVAADDAIMMEGAQHWKRELDALEEATAATAAAAAMWAALG